VFTSFKARAAFIATTLQIYRALMRRLARAPTIGGVLV
jgi:hypothetical protein